jgi:hypothetical protein
MWLELLKYAAPVVIGYAIDRWKYARTIAKHADVLVKNLPDGDAKAIAEQAVILANVTEAQAIMKRLDAQIAESKVREAAILAGNGTVNVGSLSR